MKICEKNGQTCDCYCNQGLYSSYVIKVVTVTVEVVRALILLSCVLTTYYKLIFS